MQLCHCVLSSLLWSHGLINEQVSRALKFRCSFQAQQHFNLQKMQNKGSAAMYKEGHFTCLHPQSYNQSTIITLVLLQMIKMGSDVEAVLRQAVIQMEHVGEKKLCTLFFPSYFFLQKCECKKYETEILTSLCLSQCFDPERAFYQKMSPIVTSQGKSHDRPSDYIFFIPRKRDCLSSITIYLHFEDLSKTTLEVVQDLRKKRTSLRGEMPVFSAVPL